MRYADSCCTYTEEYVDGQQYYVYIGPCIISRKMITVKVKGEELFLYRQGVLIQNALISNTLGEREFLMSGISEEQFDAVFGP